MPACDVGDAQRCVTLACPARVRALRCPYVDIPALAPHQEDVCPPSPILASFFSLLLLPLAPPSLSLFLPLITLSSFSYPSLLFSSSLRQRRAQQGYPLPSCTLHLMSFNLPCEPPFYMMEPLATMNTNHMHGLSSSMPHLSLIFSPRTFPTLPLLAPHPSCLASQTFQDR